MRAWRHPADSRKIAFSLDVAPSSSPNQQQQAQQEVFEDTNVFTSFAVPPEDEDLPFSYLPVPSMDILRNELQDRIKARNSRLLCPHPPPSDAQRRCRFRGISVYLHQIHVIPTPDVSTHASTLVAL